jgi:hypothetical protein
MEIPPMSTLLESTDGQTAGSVRCPICAQPNARLHFCRHVRWTFDQGDPIEFARFALEMSPYVRARGGRPNEIPGVWWSSNGDWVVDKVLLHFDAIDGYVFGEVAGLDLLARGIWKAFSPDVARSEITRTDP